MGMNDLPTERVKQVEAGLALYQKAQADVERLMAELKTANETITRQKIELEELHHMVSNLEGRTSTFQIERDQAVADRVTFETLFASIVAQLRMFKMPEPISKVIDAKQLDRIPERSIEHKRN